MDENPSSSRIDRKTIEKNRRNEMKSLYSKLTSHVPHQFRPREMASLPDQLEGATNYIKMQEAKVKKMKQKKDCLTMGMSATASNWSSKGSPNLPNIDVRVTGSALQVVLITGLHCQFMFNAIIKMLHEEEGSELIAATFSVIDNTVFHTIHCKIADQSTHNYGAERISNRLRKFVYDSV